METKTDAGCLGVVTVHMPCEFGYLRIARQNVRDFSSRSGLSEFKTAQLEMALDEACTNVIEHSYGQGSGNVSPDCDKGIHLTLIQYADRVEVELIDFGAGFEYDQVQTLEPEDYVDSQRGRGLGLYIIRNFVDEAEYNQHPETGNCLKLRKRI